MLASNASLTTEQCWPERTATEPDCMPTDILITNQNELSSERSLAQAGSDSRKLERGAWGERSALRDSAHAHVVLASGRGCLVYPFAWKAEHARRPLAKVGEADPAAARRERNSQITDRCAELVNCPSKRTDSPQRRRVQSDDGWSRAASLRVLRVERAS